MDTTHRTACQPFPPEPDPQPHGSPDLFLGESQSVQLKEQRFAERSASALGEHMEAGRSEVCLGSLPQAIKRGSVLEVELSFPEDTPKKMEVTTAPNRNRFKN
ncbi:Ubiquitin-Conjugating Enzyme E2 G1 [Manis pentadactyla]|nr:Ubiquitin-Conjugating Enzyme E2 G1 [Manis pentadactyla]